DDVVRNVKRQQEDREQRRDDQDCVLLHSMLPVFDSALVESERAPTVGPPAMRASLDKRADRVAARVRSSNQLATKSGFAPPKGGYVSSNGGLHLPEEMQ